MDRKDIGRIAASFVVAIGFYQEILPPPEQDLPEVPHRTLAEDSLREVAGARSSVISGGVYKQ